MESWPAPLKVLGLALSDWWDDWVNMLFVNLVWVLCWMTIVLGPPATLGLYHVTHQLARGDSLGLRGLWEGGCRYFLASWQWALLNLVAAVIVEGNVWFYASLHADWASLLQAFFLLLGLAWLIVQFYALPYLMEQEQKSWPIALRNGLFTVLAAPGYTVVVVGAAALVVALSVGLVAPFFLGGPGLIAALGSRAVQERLETYRVRERDAARQK